MKKGDLHNEALDLDINFDAVEKKILGLVNMKRDQGRKEQEIDELKAELYLEPKIDMTKENKNKTSAKMAPPHKIKENPNAVRSPKLGTTTDEKADLRKAINATKPNVPNIKMMKPSTNPKLAKKPPSGKPLK